MPVVEAFAVAVYLLGLLMAIKYVKQRNWAAVGLWAIASICGVAMGMMVYLVFTIWVGSLVAVVIIAVHFCDTDEYNQNTQGSKNNLPGNER